MAKVIDERDFMNWLSFKKALYCAARVRFWRQLTFGVTPTIEHALALQRFSFRTVVDIGANRGQFATFALELYPAATIHSFEPLAAPASVFCKVMHNANDVHFYQNAIGNKACDTTIYITTRDDSSSLLPPTPAQHELFGVQLARTSQIQVKRLSDCISILSLKSPALLKIDVQGGELDVLNGCDDLLERFDAVYVECSFVLMYKDQPLYHDVERWMGKHGFCLSGVYNQHHDRARGAVQADFLFSKIASGSGISDECAS